LDRYSHLDLVDWPFQIVPDSEHCKFIADRKQLKNDIELILRNFSRRDTSTINVMWAWYGAGKTHSLKYLAYRFKSVSDSFIPIYIEFPRETRSFLDLYKSFISQLNIDLAIDSYLEVFTSPAKSKARIDLNREYPDLAYAMNTLSMVGGDKAELANNWLRAQNIPLNELRKINIHGRIDSAEKALKVISWIIQLFNWAKPYEQMIPVRIIWMIDEFQRIERGRDAVQKEINDCLLSVFNRCPRSFSLFLSFSGHPSKKMPSWLSKDLADRIGMEKILVLPSLTSDEANLFIKELISFYRMNQINHSEESFPFSSKARSTIVDFIQKKGELKPRNIMQACNAVLEEADLLIENKSLNIIDESFVQKVFSERTFIETENEDY